MKRQFSRPISREIWRMASRKGWLSMSPMVPPISVMSTSAPVDLAPMEIKLLISLVMWGITCTVWPR